MATNRAIRDTKTTILGGFKDLDKKMDGLSRQQAVQLAAQTPIAMLQGIQPPYFYGDEGEDVEAFIYALVNCASANDWKEHKTVSNLAHFLDGRAGYAFRAAVKHRVERAQGSLKEALEEKRKTKEKLEQLRTEKDEAGKELQNIGAQIGVLTKVKEEGDEEEGEAKSSDDLAAVELQIAELNRDYTSAAQLFSTACVQFATAQKEATAAGLSHSSTALPTTEEAGASDHAIAFPSLESALTWLRNTFRREDVEDKLTGDYFGRRQGLQESVQDYALELLKLSSRAGLVTSEEKQVKHFVEGLRPRLKKTLKHFVQVGKIAAKMSDWEGMIKATGQLEREHPALKSDKHHDRHSGYDTLNSMEATTTADTTIDTEPQQSTPKTYQFEEFINAVSALTDVVQASVEEKQGRDQLNNDRARRCYNCHEIGHLSWQCPQRPSDQTQQYRARRSTMPRFSPTCYRCNKVGHYSNACPEAAQQSRGVPKRENRRPIEGRGQGFRGVKQNAPPAYRGQHQSAGQKQGNDKRV